MKAGKKREWEENTGRGRPEECGEPAGRPAGNGRRPAFWKMAALAAAVCMCVLLCAALGGCGGQGDGDGADSSRTEQGDASDRDESENAGGTSGEDASSREFYAMDTYMTVTAYGPAGEKAAEQAEAEVHRLDALLSTGDPDSEISRLNKVGSGTLSEETAGLVKTGMDMYGRTGKAFDIAIYPVMEAWGFTDGKYRVPSEKELQKLLPLTDASKIQAEGEKHTVTFEEKGMAIDLGGIAKGYTSGRIIEVFRHCGVKSGLVNLGGNVQALGSKPDGSDWRIAVQDPRGDGYYLGVLEASDIAVITSGAYERNFTQGGKRYHHIIDPATGYPAEKGLQSVTIVCPDATLADALSTSLYVMGKEEAIKFWKEHNEEFECILLDDQGELYITPSLEKQFVSDEYRINVIR